MHKESNHTSNHLAQQLVGVGSKEIVLSVTFCEIQAGLFPADDYRSIRAMILNNYGLDLLLVLLIPKRTESNCFCAGGGFVKMIKLRLTFPI
jgi:hypothetical protein